MKPRLFQILFIFLIFTSSCVVKPKMVSSSSEKGTLWTVQWSPDGRYIATGGNQDILRIFDAETFTNIKTYPVENVILSRLKWHPTLNKLAVITQSGSFRAQILDLDTDKWTELKNLSSTMRALDWSPSGDFLAVSELSEFVSVFDLQGNQISRFKADEKGVTGLDWHPTEDLIVTVGSQIGLFTSQGDTINTFYPELKETFMLCVEWHPSGNFFAVGDYGDLEKAENKALTFWQPEGIKYKQARGSVGEYRNIRWSPDDKHLATASDRLSIYNTSLALVAESDSQKDYLWGIDWNADGTKIITTDSKGRITLWDDRAKKIMEIEY